MSAADTPPAVDLDLIEVRGHSAGSGAYAAVLSCAGKQRVLAAGFVQTSRTRLALTALVAGLDTLTRPCAVTVYSSSIYLAEAFSNGWLDLQALHEWRETDGTPVKNHDLWRRVRDLLCRHHVALHPVAAQQRDQIKADGERAAHLAAAPERLQRDEGFEAQNRPATPGLTAAIPTPETGDLFATL